jgi:molecular chaperone DnaK
VKIRQGIDSLRGTEFAILRRIPRFLEEVFTSLVKQRERFNDQAQAKSLIESGKTAISAENYDRLQEVISGLINLLPQQEKKEMSKSFTGLS